MSEGSHQLVSASDFVSITDEDITWSAALLRLSPTAFMGEDGSDPRRQIIKSMDTIDVAACPGSGKTTLLVAKLAIAAERWQYRTRGICALSHTNVARNEIETRLSNTTAGRKLLTYPHYIGTIHGFVNDFLAIPWLRRRGYPIRIIDTEICQRRRWYKLLYKTRAYLEKQNVDQSSFEIRDASFNVAKKSGQFKFGSNTATYEQLKKACHAAAEEGYHCYDDMFIWANNMLDEIPEILHVVRDRFPLVFVDEAQDNSEEQSTLLQRLFPAECQQVIRQRFGDPNQAIFDSPLSNQATTDKFPLESKRKDLPSSHRFGQRIADLADPLGLIPYGLKGLGPQKRPLASGAQEGLHTIFLFGNDKIHRVLVEYCELLLETFSDRELREGSFTAVGQVHRPPILGGSQKIPHNVGDYWSAYDSELGRRDSRPKTFIQYIFAGLGTASKTGQTYSAVDKIAEGILRLASTHNNCKMLGHSGHPHRYLSRHLPPDKAVKEHYSDLLAFCAEKREAITEKLWNDVWRMRVKQIAEEVAGGALTNPEATEFLSWSGESPESALGLIPLSRSNIYRHSRDGRQVDVRVGSIHSVKGETHTATLVLETFWQKHNLAECVPWLLGDKCGQETVGVQQQLRLKIHYVAMTRPTHLLCLAVKKSVVDHLNGSVNTELIDRFLQRGWHIKMV